MSADLIARLEKATGPDRELDEAIQKALGRSQREYMEQGDEGISILIYPSYTASLDAALTLVPKSAVVLRIGQGDVSWAAVCEGYRDTDKTYTIQAATPALALCIAALKARGDSQ